MFQDLLFYFPTIPPIGIATYIGNNIINNHATTMVRRQSIALFSAATASLFVAIPP
jgi:hypothetical protein